MSDQNTLNREKLKHPHRMSRAGYDAVIERLRLRAIAAGDKDAQDPSWMPERFEMWIDGRIARDGSMSPGTRAVADTIVSEIYINLKVSYLS